jgi:ABC-type molybdenum transport system ATPase subunit/photorepair protein PhrA
MNAVRPSTITGYRSGRYSWDLHGLLGSGKITLAQVLTAFQYDYDPVLKLNRRRIEPAATVAQMTYCKGR